MSDTHAEAALHLADEVAGRLTADESSRVRAHLGACADCRETAEAYRLMAAAAAHPDSALLAERALVSEAAASPDDALAHHLAACADCREEVAMARAANLAAPPSAERPRAPAWLPLAAVLVAGLLGLALFVTWRDSAGLARRLSALETENVALRTQVAELEKPAPPVVSYLFLRPVERGTAAHAQLALGSGQDVYLALGLEIPATLRQPGEAGHLAVSDPEGRSVWETDVAAASLDAALSRGEALLVKIPSDRLRPGRQAIRLTAPGEGRTWFRSEFEITRGSPDPKR